MSDKRRYPRVSCKVCGLLEHEDTCFNCRLENISLSGALVSLTDSSSGLIRLGDPFFLKIGSDGDEEPFVIPTRVAHIGFSLLGLAFLELDGEVRNSLETVLAKAAPAPVSRDGVKVHHPADDPVPKNRNPLDRVR